MFHVEYTYKYKYKYIVCVSIYNNVYKLTSPRSLYFVTNKYFLGRKLGSNPTGSGTQTLRGRRCLDKDPSESGNRGGKFREKSGWNETLTQSYYPLRHSLRPTTKIEWSVIELIVTGLDFGP